MYNLNKFIDRQIAYIIRVKDNMILLEKNRHLLPFKIPQFDLLRRGLKHDLSKFSKNSINAYIIAGEYYYNINRNLPTDHLNMEYVKTIKNRHYIKEKHHPHNKIKMSNLDICEMCCDLSAIAWEFNEKNYTKYYLEKHIKDFPILEKYNDNILFILKLLEKLNS